MQKMIDIRTEDGNCDTYISFPDGVTDLPLVIFYMDAIGLRQRIFDMVDQLAGEGYFVIAPNLFYRTKRTPIMDYSAGLLKAENSAERLKIMMPLINSLTPELAKRDAQAFLAFGKAQPQVKAGKIGAVGYCLGGSHALRAAASFPLEFAAIASFHAGNLATESETSPHRLFPSIQAEVYIGHADQDQGMPVEQREKVRAALESAGVQFEAELFTGARHGWTMKDLPIYDPQADAKHWQRLLALFARRLKG